MYIEGAGTVEFYMLSGDNLLQKYDAIIIPYNLGLKHLLLPRPRLLNNIRIRCTISGIERVRYERNCHG